MEWKEGAAMGQKGNKTDGLEIFHSAPVPEAVIKNAVPSMAAMLMVLVYNLADTFFIGQTHDALQMSAVSLATPALLLLMSLGQVFGIGGMSVIARAMGEGRQDYARQVCAFCMWACIVTGVVSGGAVLFFMDDLLHWLGASPDTFDMARSYLAIVFSGCPLGLISVCYGNIIRAEGQANMAMAGQVIGNALNIILDPVFILYLDMNVAGAAIATLIGNFVAAAYYVGYFLCGKSLLSIHPRDVSLRNGIPAAVFSIGVPAALGSVCMSFSQIVANARLAAYNDMALAGYGVAAKVNMVTSVVCIGLGQGVQPLLGYCLGARLKDRFRRILRFSFVSGLLLSIVLTALCYVFTGPLVRVFITDPDAFGYGTTFVRIMLTTSCLFGAYYVLLSTLQAVDAATEALVLNLSRQGFIFLPALFLLEHLIGITGIVWAQPAADLLSLLLAAVLAAHRLRKLEIEFL